MACQEEGERSTKGFKGVEGFLRRVAFNLGNSPSQTEVKIISCIPIDVTDLQQKIIHLERQLEESNCPVRSETQCPVEVHTAFAAPEFTPCEPGPARVPPCAAAYPPPCAAAYPPPCAAAHTPACAAACAPACAPTCAAVCALACTPADLQCPSASYALPPYPENCPRRKSTVSFNVPGLQPKPSRGQQREPLCSNATFNDVETRRRNLFKRHKKPRKNSPLIYYAHTTTSPFNNYKKEVAARREMKRMDAAIKPPFVSDMLRKQYFPEMYLEEWTGSSQASAPVCRDRARAPPRGAGARTADACSCCRGRFYDLDLDYRPYRLLDESLSTNMHHNVDSGNIYYNSSYYDIFPVKEKADTIKRENDKFKKWEPKIHFDDTYFQDNYLTKIECRPVLTNTKFSPAPRCVKKAPGKFLNRRGHAPKRVLCSNESSRNTSVECGDIYIKRSVAKKRKSKNKTILLKNVECITHNVNDTECQTESSKNLRPETSDLPEESRTESTLDQIKAILQSVLSHVKTNNLMKVQADNKEKKDAIVQKELQSNSPACSRLLNSYTYSPFSMDPYMASCSRAVPGACAPVVMPQAPAHSSHFKCMQNFPVFIQHKPAQRQCSGCYYPRPELNRHPIQTSTNTLPLPAEEKRSKETENLIKEIYNSMALNIPIKRASHSDYNDQKLTNMSRVDSGEPLISNMMMMSRQVGSKAQGEKVRSRPAAVSTATTSRATSSTRSALSNPAGAGTGTGTGTGSQRRALVTAYESGTTASTVERRPRRKPNVVVDSESPSEEGESGSASASGSDDTIVPSKQPAKEAVKTGIFKKMFGSVFKRRRKIKQEDHTSSVAEDSESDSDDYQTVYSQKVERPNVRHVTYAPARARSRARRSLQRLQPPRGAGAGAGARPRRPPYLEQEQRRYWDEQLMFQKPPPKHSSERAPSRPRSIRSRLPGIYFHKYEARQALVDAPGPFKPEPDYHDKEHGQYDPEYDPEPRPRKNVSLKVSNKKISWLKRHSPKIKCADQWKRLMLEG